MWSARRLRQAPRHLRIDLLVVQVQDGVQRDQRDAIVEQINGFLEKLVKILGHVVGARFYDGAQLLLGSADQEIRIWHALVVEPLRPQQRGCTTLIAVIAHIRYGLAAWRWRWHICTHRWHSESTRLNRNVAAPGLRAAAQVLVRQLRTLIIVAQDAAPRCEIAANRLHSVAMRRLDWWAKRTLLEVRSLADLAVRHVSVVLACPLNELRPLVTTIIFGHHAKRCFRSSTLGGLVVVLAVAEVLTLRLLGKVVVAVDALAWQIVVVGLPVERPGRLVVRLHLDRENHVLTVGELSAWIAETLGQHLKVVATRVRLRQRLFLV